MTSIGDLNSQMLVSGITDGMDRNTGLSRGGQSADFKSAFANATGQINIQNRDIQTETKNFSSDNRDNSFAGASAEKKSYAKTDDKTGVKSEKNSTDDI